MGQTGEEMHVGSDEGEEHENENENENEEPELEELESLEDGEDQDNDDDGDNGYDAWPNYLPNILMLHNYSHTSANYNPTSASITSVKCRTHTSLEPALTGKLCSFEGVWQGAQPLI